MFFNKNFFTFITSVIMALVLVFFAVIITSYQSGFIEEKFSLTEDGNFLIMGNTYKPNKAFADSMEKYLALCEKAYSALFPDIITDPLKKSAASLMDAAYGLFDCLGKTLSGITRGNM